MKRALLGAAAALAIVAPTAAHADSSRIGVGYTNYDFTGGDLDGLNLNGAFQTEVNGFDLQFDAGTRSLDAGGTDVGFSNATVHGGWGNGDHYFGGFAGLNSISGLAGYQVGLEGQWHMSQFSVNGAVGYTTFDTGGGDVDMTDVGGDFTWAFTDNLDVTLTADWVDVDSDDGTVLGLKGGWRFDNSPVSIEVGYERGDFDSTSDVDAWRIGFVFDFGTSSRSDARRNGPSLNGGERLANNIVYAL